MKMTYGREVRLLGLVLEIWKVQKVNSMKSSSNICVTGKVGGRNSAQVLIKSSTVGSPSYRRT